MPRYIDADDAIYRLDKYSYEDKQPRAIRRAAKLLDAFANERTADVQEVKHGKWEQIYPDFDLCVEFFKCSICGSEKSYSTPYCPYCGAKMDEEKEAI